MLVIVHTHFCYECGASFASKRALTCHCISMHEYISPLQYRIADATCPVCMIHFCTRKRCLHHVDSVAVCRNVVLEWEPQLTLDEVQSLKADDQMDTLRNLNMGFPIRYAKNLCFLAKGPINRGFSAAFHRKREAFQLLHGNITG